MADTRNAERVAALAAKERKGQPKDHHDHRQHTKDTEKEMTAGTEADSTKKKEHRHHRHHHGSRSSRKRHRHEEEEEEAEDENGHRKSSSSRKRGRREKKHREKTSEGKKKRDETDDEKRSSSSKSRSRSSSRDSDSSRSRSSGSKSGSEDDEDTDGAEGKEHRKRKGHRQRSKSLSPSSSSDSSSEEDSPRPLSPTLKMRRRHRRKDRSTKFDMTPEQAEQLKNSAASNSYLPSNSFAPSMGFAGTNQAHTRHARRIYVGGIGTDVTEADMTAFFNAVIERVYKPMEGGAVVSVYINHERKFAFVELREIALATAAMELDGIPYNGQPLKIRRPNDYTPSAIPAGTEGTIKFDLSKLGIVSTTVEDGPNKVFVGGLPHHLNEKQVQELLQAFGRLKSFHLVRDVSAGTSKGYGFCEFLDPEVTDDACQGLNNMQIGDRVLTVRRATAQDNNQGDISAQPAEVWQPQSEAADASQQQAPTSTAPSKQPTQLLQLCHMVTPDMLSDDQEYEDIVLDVKEECEQYGSVKEVRIPRSGSCVGNIYIHFGGIDEAIAAATALAGRMFESRLVSAEYVTEEEFQQIAAS
eukprot:gb/GECG01011182.1/.p1 GENE.gb/GECG01011182.1/~~gb/GECG01011182.1/.p1  ORF type:complete len:584 (+),score=112.86 gb/GECG01011182.1/:1-1752(+)